MEVRGPAHTERVTRSLPEPFRADRVFHDRDLTGQIAAEDAERASRMRAELSRAAKTDREFARNIEQSRQVTGIERKRKEKEARDGHGATGAGPATAKATGKPAQPMALARPFAQVPLARKRTTTAGVDDGPPEEVARVLSKIF